MNAEEFKSVLTRFDATLTNMARRSLNSEAAIGDVQTLINVLRDLDRHRLAMEAAEEDKKPDPEMEAARKCAICHHRECVVNSSLCAGCYKTVTGQSDPPTLVAVSDLATRRDLERIEKRLDEIERKHEDFNRYYERHMANCHTSTRR